MNIKKLFDKSLLRFLLVGAANTLVGMAVMFSLYNLAGFGYWAASVSNYVLTSILSFFLNKYFTFQNRARSAAQVLRFALNIAVCYLLAYAVAKPLVYAAMGAFSQTVRDNAAMLVGMCLFTGLNYIGQRFFAFKE